MLVCFDVPVSTVVSEIFSVDSVETVVSSVFSELTLPVLDGEASVTVAGDVFVSDVSCDEAVGTAVTSVTVIFLKASDEAVSEDAEVEGRSVPVEDGDVEGCVIVESCDEMSEFVVEVFISVEPDVVSGAAVAVVDVSDGVEEYDAQ